MQRGDIVYYSLLLSTHGMAIEKCKAKVDVQITILRFAQIESTCAYLMT